MDGYSTYMEGHGVFGLHHSGHHSSGPILRAFNKTAATTNSDFWYSQTTSYNGTDNAYDSNGSGEGGVAISPIGINGEWMYITLPYHVDMKYLQLTARNGEPTSAPKSAVIFGSTDGGVTWEQVGSFTNRTVSNHWLDGGVPSPSFVINSKKPLNAIGFVVTHSNSNYAFTLGEIKFFGTPGPTTLDKGSLTLGRSLDVPRISRYDVDTETPRPEKLLIDYDTTVNSSLTDISGQGNHGRFFSDAQYSAADKAFKFDGTDDYTQTPITIAGGNMAWTQSLWFKVTAFLGSGVYSVLSFFGNKSGLSGIITSYKAGNMWQDWYGNGVYFDYTFEVGQWYHSVSVYHGNTSTDPNVRSSMYINGVKQTLTFYSAISSPMTLPTSTFYELADHINASNTRHNGLISNVKLYNVALEASEVQKLYRLGRTGRSMVISDTAVGIGKVPEAQLDVRGTIGIDNILWRGGDWSHPLLPEAEFYWNPQSYISKPFSNGTTAGSTITDINGKLNGIQGNTGWHNNWWAPVTSASYIETLGNVDLTRDWTIVMWNKSTAGSTRLAGHGAMEPSKGFHLANSGTNKIRFGFYGNDIDTDSDYYTHSNTWCQYAATYYHGTGATHNRQLFQNERNILDMRAGRHDSGTPPTSTNYAASTDLGDQRLRFGTSYGSGNYANLANKYGPIAFFGRVLSAGEIRSLYNYFRITWQPGGDDLA
jgi:hypothetical protein